MKIVVFTLKICSKNRLRKNEIMNIQRIPFTLCGKNTKDSLRFKFTISVDAYLSSTNNQLIIILPPSDTIDIFLKR